MKRLSPYQLASMQIVGVEFINASNKLNRVPTNYPSVRSMSNNGVLLQNYIARFGHGSAKLARQAQSKEKTLAKMVAGGLTEKVTSDKSVTFLFYSCGTIPPPVIMVQVRCESNYYYYSTQ